MPLGPATATTFGIGAGAVYDAAFDKAVEIGAAAGRAAYDLRHPSDPDYNFEPPRNPYDGSIIIDEYGNARIDPRCKRGFDLAQRFTPRRDPLTLDLDGNGLDTVGISTTNPIYFDHGGDGVKVSTGWVLPSDGFLALDRDGNGTIDSGRELFGDSTVMYGGRTAHDGFDALWGEDTNTDGKVDSADANWNALRVWRDLNQDAISSADELFTLDQLDIASIKVAKTNNSEVLPDGNRIADLGTFTRTDGSTGTVGDVGQLADIDLVEDTFNSQFLDHIALADGVDALPGMQGSGQVRNLREAASIDTDAGHALRTKLAAYSAATTRAEQRALLDDLVIAWGATSSMQTSIEVNLHRNITSPDYVLKSELPAENFV